MEKNTKLIIHSKLEALDTVYTWLKEILEPITSEGIRDNILLVTYEIVTNAIIHGNQENPSTSVKIDLDKYEDKIMITIEDEGTGYNSLPSKEEAKNLNFLEEGGRGLKLAVLICDEIELDKNEIKLIFALHGKDEE